jgi:pilus assembly protein CpaB
MNKRRITGIVAAVLFAIIGTASLVGYVNSAKQKVEASDNPTSVYVVHELVHKGADASTIRASVSTEQVPKRLVQRGAIRHLKDISAQDVAGSDLQPGDQLVAARLAKKNQVAPVVSDRVQVSAQFTPDRAVGGKIAKGDTVGVYLSFPKDPPADLSIATTHLELQKVLVTNVQTTDQATQADNGKKTPNDQVSASGYIVTLALTPAQSERFVFANEFGHVWLSNEPATVSDDGTQITTIGNVYTVAK